MHLNEDDLILHYYGEVEPADRRSEAGATAEDRRSEAGIDAHLAACVECRGAFEQLRRVMETLDAAPVERITDANHCHGQPGAKG